MFWIKLYFIKGLKKLGILSNFNFILTKKLNGKVIKVPFINGIGLTNFVLEKDWLDNIIKIFVKENANAFIDVGVNIGQTLLRVKTTNPHIKYLGFEPNSTCTSYSQQLVKVNKFSDCIIQNCALSTAVENLVLEKTLIDDSRATLISNLRPNYFTEKEHVLALDYQSFYLNTKISFIKIDVEGAELEVLKGMAKAIIKHQPIIVCEVLDSHSDEVLEFTQKRASLVCNLIKSLNYGIIQLQTSQNNDKLVSFNKIYEIRIKQWTPQSYNYNDYMFYPKNEENSVIEKLRELC
ncbi:MAG: FkbM family methyltransferase [Bacteroidales bacterium]|jgi:FkbM family methyltransferase